MEQRKYTEVYTESIIEKKFKVILIGGKDSILTKKSFHDTGYAFNIRPGIEMVKVNDSNTAEKRSVIYIYLVNASGDTLRVTYYAKCYFYVNIATALAGISTAEWDHYRLQVITFLESLANTQCSGKVEISMVSKINLDSLGHIQKSSSHPYRSLDLIQLSFSNVEDAYILRKELEERIKRNKKKTASLISAIRQESGDSYLKDNFYIEDHRCPQTLYNFRHQLQAYLDEDPFLLVDNLFEYDVPLVARACIDTAIRCGKWYDIEFLPNEQVKITPSIASQQSVKPPLRYLVWDIEVTKDKLKFPTPQKDSISLISFMFDNQGFLIVNRSILSEDINDFEYIPKRDLGAKFHILNVKNEKALIEAFYEYIQKISPHIFVTYNGDNFDFEFLRIRGSKYGISMLTEIGFPYSSTDGSPPSKIGQPITTRTALGTRQEYQGRFQVHVDCLRWVERDSYLPCGSRGLKAVTKSKLGYNPRELDPELMERYALEQPRLLAEYSVSDALATYYLYEKFIHGFTFALASIIPLAPDDVLRKGSGTLCEHLLMAEAHNANVLFKNKHTDALEKWIDGKLIISETYSGGNVAQLNSGIFRSDIPEHFNFNPKTYDVLFSEVDNVLDFWLEHEEGKDIHRNQIINLDEVDNSIRQVLNLYRNCSHIKEEPLIYHYDVAAMYPNIILSNRLQPTAIVLEDFHCKHCPYFSQRKQCQKPMNWHWKAEVFPLNQAQIELVRDQLTNERFSLDHTTNNLKYSLVDGKSDDSSLELKEEENAYQEVIQRPVLYNDSVSQQKVEANEISRVYKSWNELTEKQRFSQLFERLKLVSRKVAKKFKVGVDEKKIATVCMRENSFYVETVRKFRDRRYVLKEKRRDAEQQLNAAEDPDLRQKYLSELVLYDSLQLAHKCILNSFYGYVMRKGSRWYSMEMAAIVTYTGVQIIRMAYNLLNDIGKPLELDTDGIWTLLPKRFPQTYDIIFKDPESNCIKRKKFNFMCSFLNLQLYKLFRNEQYMTLNSRTGAFEQSTEHSIFFEIDGPYKAIVLPASEKEGMSVKKRYAVFDYNNRIVELKGFELKRRGELELIKLFQEEVFPKFLEGRNKEEVYRAVATVANRWLDFLDTRGRAADDISEIFGLIAESKFLSKPVSEQRNTKSMGITTAKRLTQLLGDSTYVNEKGIKCEYVLCANPDMEKTLRAIPVQLFEASLDIQQFHLQRWLGISPSIVKDPRSFLDWSYYRQRLETAILKIIVIPALREGLHNPVPRVAPPEWISRNLSLTASNQTRLSSFFSTLSTLPSDDIESVAQPLQRNDESSRCYKADHELSHEDARHSWLLEQQKKWKTIRCAFQQMREEYAEVENRVEGLHNLPTALPVTSIPYEVFHQRLEETEREYIEWFILDIERDIHYTGLFHFYVILGHLPYRIFRIPILHFRQIILNGLSSSFNINTEGIYVEKLEFPQIYTLPRGFKKYHLYKLLMTEEKFKFYHYSLRPTREILSVYGKHRPLEFDLLFSYGDTIRLNSQDSNAKIKIVNCGATKAFSGPDGFEQLQRDTLSKNRGIPPPVQWIFLIILHDGPVDNPTRVISFIFRPPVLLPVTGEVKVEGSTTIFVSEDITISSKQHPPINFSKAISSTMKLFKTKKLPNFFTLNETITSHVIENWVFHSPVYFSSVNLGLQQLHPYIKKLSISTLVQGKPPLIASILTSLPTSILGPFADPSKRPTLRYPIIPLHVTKTSMPNRNLERKYFFSYTTKIAVKYFIEQLYLVEWSTFVASAIHIPVIKMIQWTTSPDLLQRNILDLTLARGLQANHMVPWDSDQLTPDLGTPLLQDRTVSDFKLPEETNSLRHLAYPSISWTITFRLGFNGQLTTEALINLDKLATMYSDPIRYAFEKKSRPETKSYSTLFVHPDSISIRNVETDNVNHSTNEMFQHTSNIPAKTLVVLHRCLRHLDSRIRSLASSFTVPESMNYTSSRQDAINFLSATTRYVQAWLDTPTSLFYDSALQAVAQHWTMRYMQSFVQEIKTTSENFVKPILLSLSHLIISTPTLSLYKAQQCLALLFKALKKCTLFQNIQPQSCVAYRGFYLFNHQMWLGLRLANQHHNMVTGWENQLCCLLQLFPGPLQYFIQRVVEDFITFPLRSAGLSPNQELFSDQEEKEKLEIVNHFAQEQVLPAHSDQIVNKGVLGLATTWIEKLQDFASLKEDWYSSNHKIAWENRTYEELHHKTKLFNKVLQLPYINVEMQRKIKKQLEKLCRHLTSPKANVLNALIWSVPNLPGLIKLEQVEASHILQSHELCGINSQGNMVHIVPTINENLLQITTSRILFTLLKSHPFYWTLETESREAWLDMFASLLHISAYNQELEYTSLYSPLIPINPVLCSICGQTFPINLTASLVEDASIHEPLWLCPFCSGKLQIHVIEVHLIEFFYDMMEAAQAQDILCTKCRQLKKKISTSFCECGGEYSCRISRIEFQFLWSTFRSLVEKYPLSFPLLFSIVNQTIQFKCF